MRNTPTRTAGVFVAITLLASTLSCDSTPAEPPAPGSLTISLEVPGPLVIPPSQYRARIVGPTATSVLLTPGTPRAVDDLDPGSYTVAVEALIGTEALFYGERAGIAVASMTDSPLLVDYLAPFAPLPTLDLPSPIPPGQALSVTWNAVPGANEYRVEWANTDDFAELQSVTTSTTSQTLETAEPGQRFVRLRAINQFGVVSTPSDVLFMDVNVAACAPGQTSVVSRVGDTDGFGLGLTEGDIRPVPTSVWDAREPGDPEFTDRWNAFDAALQGRPFKDQQLEYVHTFPAPGSLAIAKATFSLFALGIQDGDSQVQGSDVDLRLYVDGLEVPMAFDSTDQFFWFNDGWVQQAGTVRIPLSPQSHSDLIDGRLDIALRLQQLGEAPTNDAFSVDYSELVVCLN